MNNQASENNGYEDLQAAASERRDLRDHGPYRVAIGNDRLEYHHVVLDDPIPTGAQVLEAAGFPPIAELLVYQVLRGGVLEGLRPTETTDLRARGVEKFLVLRGDRSFRLELNGRASEWPASIISGATLKALVAGAANDFVWQSTPHGDRFIGDLEFVHLDEAGVEKIFVGKPTFNILVNGTLTEVHKDRLSFGELVRIAFPDAVFNATAAFTVVYSRGPSENPEGSLVEGQTAKIRNRMVFDVEHTDRS